MSDESKMARLLTRGIVKANMEALPEDKLQDEELISQMS